MAAVKIVVSGSDTMESPEGDDNHYSDVEAGNIGGTATILRVVSLRQHRLVSLDVFRGITVTVSKNFYLF
jgi:hypothetical protein